MRTVFARLALLALASGLALGCQGLPLDIQEIPVTAEPSQQVSRLDQQLERARQADVETLAPTWFARAEESLEAARELRSEGGAVDEILQHVAQGLAELERAESSRGSPRPRCRGPSRRAPAPALQAPPHWAGSTARRKRASWS